MDHRVLAGLLELLPWQEDDLGKVRRVREELLGSDHAAQSATVPCFKSVVFFSMIAVETFLIA